MIDDVPVHFGVSKLPLRSSIRRESPLSF
jgi:hypothetical protein